MSSIEAVLQQADDTEFAIALSNHLFARADAVGFEGLTHAERVAYCIDGLEREVNNGGFDQFFVNSAGDWAQETVSALEQIGALQTAALMRQAMAVFPGAKPATDRDERFEQLSALSVEDRARFNELDGAFYEYPDNLAQQVRQFVEQHRQSFPD